MLFLPQLYPVAPVTDLNQTMPTIPAVPAAGLAQTPNPRMGNAAEVPA